MFLYYLLYSICGEAQLISLDGLENRRNRNSECPGGRSNEARL
jgi:hypothetical protein